MHDVLWDSNTLSEEEDADEIAPTLEEIYQNLVPTTKEYAVDDIEMEYVDELIEEYKSKDDRK